MTISVSCEWDTIDKIIRTIEFSVTGLNFMFTSSNEYNIFIPKLSDEIQIQTFRSVYHSEIDKTQQKPCTSKQKSGESRMKKAGKKEWKKRIVKKSGCGEQIEIDESWIFCMYCGTCSLYAYSTECMRCKYRRIICVIFLNLFVHIHVQWMWQSAVFSLCYTQCICYAMTKAILSATMFISLFLLCLYSFGLPFSSVDIQTYIHTCIHTYIFRKSYDHSNNYGQIHVHKTQWWWIFVRMGALQSLSHIYHLLQLQHNFP